MVKNMSINLVHLYPNEMNIYGDTGNVEVIQKRLERRNIKVNLVQVGVEDDIPKNADIIISGGGQDKGQIKVQQDLQSKKADLHKLADDDCIMLVICGTYQLFGHRFITHNNEDIEGIGIFDLETKAGDTRHIGNILVEHQGLEVVGYENHSGLTYLLNDQKPFAQVVTGTGNNDSDDTEGAVYKNVYGTYLHGPILPKNPNFADKLITLALQRKYEQDVELDELDDSLAKKAFEIAKSRPR